MVAADCCIRWFADLINPERFPTSFLPLLPHRGMALSQWFLAEWTGFFPASDQTASRALPDALLADEVPVFTGLAAGNVLCFAAGIAGPLSHVSLLSRLLRKIVPRVIKKGRELAPR